MEVTLHHSVGSLLTFIVYNLLSSLCYRLLMGCPACAYSCIDTNIICHLCLMFHKWVNWIIVAVVNINDTSCMWQYNVCARSQCVFFSLPSLNVSFRSVQSSSVSLQWIWSPNSWRSWTYTPLDCCPFSSQRVLLESDIGRRWVLYFRLCNHSDLSNTPNPKSV